MYTPRLCTSSPEVPTPANYQFGVPKESKPFFRVMSATPRRQPSLFPSPPAKPAADPSTRKSSTATSCESVLLQTSTLQPARPRTATVARPSTAHSDFQRSWVLTRPVEALPSGGGITTPRRTPSVRNVASSNAGSVTQYLQDRKGKWLEHGLPRPTRPASLPPSSASPRRGPADVVASEEDIGTDPRRAMSEMDWFDDKLVSQVTKPSSPQGSVANLKALTSSTKDYYLTRTLFHAQMLGNLKALQSMKSLSDAELEHRLEALRSKYTASRLGRHDFHLWLSELVQSNTISRLESDTIFNSFDENKSGSVDEEEFIVGVQTVLRGRDRGLINVIRKLLGDVRSTVGTVMNELEVNTLLDVIGRVSRQRYPDIDNAIAVVKRSVKDFTQQAQIPTTEFCRALQVSPLISQVLDVLQEDGQLPPSPPPPPTPDPDRDIARVARVEPPPPPAAAPDAEGGINAAASGTFGSTMEAILTRPPPRKKPPVVKQSSAAPVLGKLDVAHPGFRADACLNARRFEDDVGEATDANWFIRNGVVWCRTAHGEVPMH